LRADSWCAAAKRASVCIQGIKPNIRICQTPPLHVYCVHRAVGAAQWDWAANAERSMGLGGNATRHSQVPLRLVRGLHNHRKHHEVPDAQSLQRPTAAGEHDQRHTSRRTQAPVPTASVCVNAERSGALHVTLVVCLSTTAVLCALIALDCEVFIYSAITRKESLTPASVVCYLA
jgi:hypothetical protein